MTRYKEHGLSNNQEAAVGKTIPNTSAFGTLNITIDKEPGSSPVLYLGIIHLSFIPLSVVILGHRLI